MNKLKKIIVFLFVVVLSFNMIGCAKIISTKEFTTNVEIVDIDYKAMYMQPIKAGSVTTYVTHPAKYYTYIKYGEEELKINNSKYYQYAKNHIGEIISATLKETEYDDGSVIYSIISLNIKEED